MRILFRYSPVLPNPPVPLSSPNLETKSAITNGMMISCPTLAPFWMVWVLPPCCCMGTHTLRSRLAPRSQNPAAPSQHPPISGYSHRAYVRVAQILLRFCDHGCKPLIRKRLQRYAKENPQTLSFTVIRKYRKQLITNADK